METKRRSRAPQRPPRAVTLIEILLVLAILVLIAATAWPSLERSLADQRLRDAADMVCAEWQHARAEAMSSGIAYQFCYTPDDRTYWIEACEDVQTSADGSTSGQADGRSGTASGPDRSELPEQVTFVEGKVTRASAETLAADQTPTAQEALPQTPDNGELNTPVVFSADGTCSSAELTLCNEHNRSITVSIHGLTAIPIVGEVFSTEEGQL